MAVSKNVKTPGVYLTELDAFPPSIVGVQTAVPAFLGYTEKAIVEGKPAFLKPVAITSLADFESIFGAGFKPIYNIVEVNAAGLPPGDAPAWDFQVGSSYYALQQTDDSRFRLYYSMRLFFANGGSDCYVVSVGDYKNQGKSPNGVAVSEDDLSKGIKAIHEQMGPTMLVIPDAVLLPASDSFGNIARAMLAQCGELEDRVAILDVYNSQLVTQANIDEMLGQVIAEFQSQVGNDSLSYGAAYFPFLDTSVVQTSDVNYTCFHPDQQEGTSLPRRTALQRLLERVADELHEPGSADRKLVQGYIDAITVIVEDPNDPNNPERKQKIQALNQTLNDALPPYRQWQDALIRKMSVLPASGGIAGVFTLSDQTRGVWNAPANMVMASVTSCAVKLSDAQQGQLNVPLNGKAVNAIRDFIGRGPVVWGGRTLDGNSNDWRYIQVRRTIIWIDQSIKDALKPFAFAANDGRTWVTVTSMISNFLQGVWAQGGLMGDKASDAYTVQCGLGSTMTTQDILDGYMIVQVTLQMIHPAEFIELTFRQKMR